MHSLQPQRKTQVDRGHDGNEFWGGLLRSVRANVLA